MRITIEVDENTIKEAMKLTGETKKGPAISKAASEFVRREMAKKFGQMVMDGEFEDYPYTNEELETFDR